MCWDLRTSIQRKSLEIFSETSKMWRNFAVKYDQKLLSYYLRKKKKEVER